MVARGVEVRAEGDGVRGSERVRAWRWSRRPDRECAVVRSVSQVYKLSYLRTAPRRDATELKEQGFVKRGGRRGEHH